MGIDYDASTTVDPAYEDYYGGDYEYTLDEFGRRKRGKKKAEREAAKAAKEAAKQAAKEAAAAAENNYTDGNGGNPYAGGPTQSTTQSTTTTTTTTTEYTTKRPKTTKKPNAYAPKPDANDNNNPYATGGKNQDQYASNGSGYQNGVAINTGANYGGYGGEEDNANPNGISCFHCDAANFTQCYEIGMQKPCAENQGSCMIEIRKRDGVMESVCMGCKQIAACKANRAQNFWKSRQCRPGAQEGPSVCRQCW